MKIVKTNINNMIEQVYQEDLKQWSFQSIGFAAVVVVKAVDVVVAQK